MGTDIIRLIFLVSILGLAVTMATSHLTTGRYILIFDPNFLIFILFFGESFLFFDKLWK